MSEESIRDDGIAVIGMSGRFPGAADVRELWQTLKAGREGLAVVDEDELIAAGVPRAWLLDDRYVRAGGFLDGVNSWDAPLFRCNRRQAASLDPRHRLFLECAWEALEDAACTSDASEERVGVFAGSSDSSYSNQVATALASAFPTEGFEAVIGLDKDFLTTQVSYKLNLRGPSITVQAACATSLVATHLACQSLLGFECDIALAGGVAVNFPHRVGYLAQKGSVLSGDGHCRAFDAEANGTVPSSGVGIVVLKRLEDAIRDGHDIYAVILGSAVNNDGSAKAAFTAPAIHGQAEVIAAALAMARVTEDSIGMIEAHGTGTVLGDQVELAALDEVFGDLPPDGRRCAIGSIKSNVGHLQAAAGVAGLIKATLCLKYGTLVPHLHFVRPNPALTAPRSRFYVNTDCTRWQRGGSARRAGVSSFAIGGTNAHLILEEPPEQRRISCPPSEPHLFMISARTSEALAGIAKNLTSHLQSDTDLRMLDAAHTLAVGRTRLEVRRFAVACNPTELSASLLSPDAAHRANSQIPAEGRPVVLMFTGQGSYRPGSFSKLYESEGTFRREMDHCSSLFEQHLNFDIRSAADGDARAGYGLDDPIVVQPTLFALQYSLAKLWIAWGIRPAAVLGHSLGEYAAACIAGVMTVEDAAAIVAARGRLSQATPLGAMLVVSLSEGETRRILTQGVALAAVNGPQQCVISGSRTDIESLESHLGARGVDCQRLSVDRAYHSASMRSASACLEEAAARIRWSSPGIPFVSSATGGWFGSQCQFDASYCGLNLLQTVRFTDALYALFGRFNLPLLLEVGPGATLCALARGQASDSVKRDPLPSLTQGRPNDRAGLLQTLGELWFRGAKMDWRRSAAFQGGRRVHLPTYPFERVDCFEPPDSHAQVETNVSAANARMPPERWLYTPSWKASPLTIHTPERNAEKPNSVYLVCSDHGSAIGSAVCSRLQALGSTVVVVTPGDEFRHVDGLIYRIEAGNPEHYRRVFAQLDARGLICAHVIHCASAGRPDRASRTDAQEAWGSGFFGLLALYQAAGSMARDFSIVVVTDGIAGVAGTEALSPEKAGIRSVCLASCQEFPRVNGPVIDLPEFATIPGERAYWDDYIDWLLEESRRKSGPIWIAYRAGRRLVQGYDRIELSGPVATWDRLRQRGVYLLTGGLGRIGLVIAEHLARTCSARLILVTRSALPPRSEWSRYSSEAHESDAVGRKIRGLLAIEKAGGEVHVAIADVAVAAELNKVLVEAEGRFGELHGVFHLAAERQDSSLLLSVESLRPCHFETQARPKLGGLRALDAVLAGRRLDFAVCFSSNAAVLGGIGFAAYAAANSSLDCVSSQQRTGRSFGWVTINWDGWSLQGLEPTPVAPPAPGVSRDPNTLNASEGIDSLRRVLALRGATQILVCASDLEPRLSRWVRLESEGRRVRVASDAGRVPSAQNAVSSGSVPETDLEKMICGIVGEALALEHVNIQDNFLDLGGDSLLGLRVIGRVRKTLGVDIGLAVLLGTGTSLADVAAETAAELARQLNATGIYEESLPDGSELADEERAAIAASVSRGT